MLAIGLMSGTSLDGVDAALVLIENDVFKLVDFITLPYTIEFRNKLKRNLNDDSAKLSEICSLNFELGYVFIQAIDMLLTKNDLVYKDIEFVCSHGQTIWHSPHSEVPSTLQIGEGQVISTITGIKVISNLRVADIVAGGEGAPLVPYFEYLYFKKYSLNIILQNIGGIGNLTYLKKDGDVKDVFAFDTGPGNVIIDYFMNKYYQVPFDKDGMIASSGDVINNIFDYFKNDDYLVKTPPKSTGRELYSQGNLERIAKGLDFDKYDKADIITTVTEYTVYSIVYHYRKYIKTFDKVIVSGGGAHNKYIMRRLNEELDNKVSDADEFTEINNFSDAKEAFAFAVLGYLSLTNRCGNVISATGAKYPVVLGQITLAKKGDI